MKKIIHLALLVILSQYIYAQDFITRWDLSKPGSNANSIKFDVGTTGTVNYTWETVPAGNTGSGSFSGNTANISGLPTNAIIRLKIDTTNFNQFKVTTIGINDRQRLIDVEQWGSTKWSSMDSAFYGCTYLNISSIDIPNLDFVSSTNSMFKYCTFLNGPSNINNWDVSNVTNMSSMFENAISFDQTIGNWDVSNVTDMSYMLSNAFQFNQPLGNWNTSNVTDMSMMFFEAVSFDQPIGSWNTSNVTNMKGLFSTDYNSYAIFNQPIGNWDVSNVTDMNRMFLQNVAFNQPIDNWDVNNVTNMSSMFENAISFNQPIGNWDVSNVTDMNKMFTNASTFNQPVGNWDVSNVTDMSYMFSYATSFNQPIGIWSTSNVTNMLWMFYEASVFNQSLGGWKLYPAIKLNNMLFNSGLDCLNYTSTIKGWANNPLCPNTRVLGAYSLHYGTNAQADRNYLINTKGWIISGDTMNTTYCYPTNVEPSNNQNFITIIPNPTTSVFKIEYPNNGASVILYNSFGQKLLLSKIENQSSLIDISQYSKGIYFAEITDENKTTRVKICKE